MHLGNTCRIAVAFLFFVVIGLPNMYCTQNELNFDKFTCKDCADSLSEKEVNWVVPVGYTSLSLKEYLDTSAFIKRDSLGNYFYERTENVLSTNSSTLLPKLIGIDSSSRNFLVDTLTSVLYQDTLALTPWYGAEFKEIAINDSLKFRVMATTDSLEYTISLLTIEGFQTTVVSGLNIYSLDTLLIIPINTFRIYTGGGSRKNNILSLRYSVKNNKKGKVLGASFTTKVENINLQNWTYLRGYLGEHMFSLGSSSFPLTYNGYFESVKLTVGQELIVGSYMELTTKNTDIGIPLLLQDTISFSKGSTIIDTLGISIYDNYPSITNRSSSYTQRFTNKVDDILSQRPDNLSHTTSIYSNLGRSNTFDTNQFVTSSGTYDVTSKLHIPFSFTLLEDLEISERISRKAKSIDSTNVAIDSVTVYLQGFNFFPVDTKLKIYFQDSTEKSYDSVLIDTPIPSASVDEDGNAIQETSFTREVALSRSQIYSLEKLYFLKILATLGKPSEHAKASLSVHNYLKVGAGLKSKLRVKLK